MTAIARRLASAGALAVLMAASPVAAQPLPTASEASALATVGGDPITADDFARWLGVLRARKDYATTLKTITPEGRAELLDALVAERAMALAARDEKLDTRPDVRFRIAQLTAEVLAQAWLEAKTAELTPTDDAARLYFEAHRDAFRTVDRVKARHILLRTHDDAEAARAALLAGAPFDQVARERSVDPTSKDKGGELGWIPRGLMVKPFEDALFALKAGEVSLPVASSFGVHVIRADEIDAGIVPSFEKLQAEVKRRMVATALEQFTRALAQKYSVVVNKDALGKLGR